MALVDDRTAFLLLLDEQHDSVLPSDAAGLLADPTTPAPLTLPAVVDDTITGFGREFVRASTTGLLYDDAADALKLTRAVTVLALLRLDLAALAVGNRCTLIQRGRGGAGDPICFGLRVEAVSATQAKAVLFWQTSAGADVADAGVTFEWPAGEYLMIGAVREVVAGQLVVRYQVNGEAAVGGTHALDVGGAASAEVTVGCGMTTAPAYADHLDGVLDALQVLHEAVSAEEFAWLWDRLSLDQPDGVTAVRRLVPPGPYSTDPDSRIQREFAVEGRALGHARSVARRLKEYSRPDKAWGEDLEQWETVTQHQPTPGDDLATRRERVVSFLQTVRGFGVEDVKAQLVDLFDLDVADIQIIEGTNDLSEGWDNGTPSDHAKVIAGTGAWRDDATATLNDRQRFTPGGDTRYAGVSTEKAGLYLFPLDHGDLASVRLQIDVISATPTDGLLMGLAIGSIQADEWLFVGVFRSGGAQRLGYLKYANGALDAACTTLDAAWTTDPTHLHVTHEGAGVYRVRKGASMAAALADAGVTISGGPAAPLWAGPCVVAQGGLSATPTGTVEFDNFLARTPKGRQRFNWYAYRDPGLAGSPDMEGARSVVRRVKPAHTAASAVQQLVVKCDDAGSRCDREPIGA